MRTSDWQRRCLPVAVPPPASPREVVQLGDKMCDFNEGFRMYLRAPQDEAARDAARSSAVSGDGVWILRPLPRGPLPLIFRSQYRIL